MSDHNGFTDHEILVEIRTDLKQHITDSQETELDINRQLAARPTRAEVLKWVAGFSALVSITMFWS